RVLILNRGAAVIDDSLTATYLMQNSAVAITEPVNLVINPNDTVEFTFSVPVNLVSTVDTNFKIRAWIDLAGDPVPENDSVGWKTVPSLVSPAAPQVANVTISQGDSATLHVINPDTNNLYYWFDVPVAGNYLSIADSFVTPPLYQTTVYYVEATGGFGSGSLTTLWAGGNGQSGNMFNVEALNPVTIDAFDLHVGTTNAQTVEVYYRLGGYAGYETNSSAWTLLGTTNVVGAGVGNPTYTPIGGLQLTPGQIYGLYVTLTTTTDIDYTNGTGANQFYADNNIEVTLGTGNGYPFGAVNTPRVFNGTIYYSSGNGCESLRVADTVFVTSPVIAVNAGNDTSMCAGSSVQLNVTASGGTGIYTYAWSPAGSLNNATIANPIASPVTNTTYSVTVTDSNGDTGSDGVIVLVNPGPNVTLSNIPNICINYAPYTLVQGSPAGGVYSGPGVTAGVFYPGTAGNGTHTITYSYTDPVTGCSGSATNTIFVDVCIGLNEIANGLGLSVYPNPASGLVTVTLYSEESS
ncbi:MAG TPA: hypothetical protein P5248_11405, partial [Bacteroidales bacterium]|nr:hypothetical protein [Bacteroidales bacterium]